ncbi:hypothetical protein NY054_05790 [Corynebacterium diphtheriae bv. mitis]|nr:hypothetical protein NY054_05790 [Corynebacterium diphtheriae bv. mitis]
MLHSPLGQGKRNPTKGLPIPEVNSTLANAWCLGSQESAITQISEQVSNETKIVLIITEPTDVINGCRLAVAIRDTDGTREAVQAVEDQVARNYSLISRF